MPTREEQKEKRRQLILTKALELFATKGYADTKIGDIAKAADMSMGLMFHYFESKEQLYEELVRMGAAGTNTPGELAYQNPLDYFEGFLKVLFSYAKEQPWVFYMFVLMAQARRSDGIPERIREVAMGIDQMEQSARIIEEGQRLGCIREGNPAALSFTFWSSVQGIMEQLAVSSGMLQEEGMMPQAEWLLAILKPGKIDT